jgi:hypothetical protein
MTHHGVEHPHLAVTAAVAATAGAAPAPQPGGITADGAGRRLGVS